MDQSKLLQIINKDLAELKELTDELIQSGNLSRIEIEIALSKSKLILQEFELLKEKTLLNTSEVQVKEEELSGIIPDNNFSEPLKSVKLDTITESNNGNLKEPEVSSIQTTITELESEINVEPQEQEKEEAEEPVAEQVEQIEENSLPETEIVEEPVYKQVIEDLPEVHEEDSTLEDEEEQPIVLGETFAKGKSLNDTMQENQTLDQKFASSPITNLESSIGLNDRFLFIRELFDGDGERFNGAVKELDEMSGLKEAVDYLSVNYKWKKNEASLKFAELVKRRFQS